MRSNAIKRTAALGAVLALAAAPAARAVAPEDPGSQGKAKAGEHGKSAEHGQSGNKTVMYVFKGTFDGTSAVAVDHGNAHVRKADLLDTSVTFDLSAAKVVVGDVNGDGTKDLLDVAAGDRVVVKARLPRKEPGTQPFKAKQLVDQTHAASSDSD